MRMKLRDVVDMIKVFDNLKTVEARKQYVKSLTTEARMELLKSRPVLDYCEIEDESVPVVLSEHIESSTKLNTKVTNLVSFLSNDYAKYNMCIFDIPNSYLNIPLSEFIGLSRREMIYKLLSIEGACAYVNVDGVRYKLSGNLPIVYDIASNYNQLNKKFKISYMRTGKKDFKMYTSENLLISCRAYSSIKIRKVKS